MGGANPFYDPTSSPLWGNGHSAVGGRLAGTARGTASVVVVVVVVVVVESILSK